MTNKGFEWAAIGAAVVLTGLHAAAQSAPATSLPDESLSRYAVPQQLIRLQDGRHIHMLCLGRGAPTVIMTAGLSDWAITWSKVHESIARQTRACAWDRPGFGYSDPDTQPQDIAHTTADLEQTLIVAQIKGPYVLLGHSMGAFESLRFADRHARDVRGMVLVDPSYPDQSARFAAVAPRMSVFYERSIQSDIDHMRRCAGELAARTLTQASADPDKCFDYPPDYPPRLREVMAGIDGKPAHFLTQASTFRQFDHSSRIVVNSGRHYGDMPLRILTAGQWEEEDMPPEVKAETPRVQREWNRAHDAMAALSTDGTNVVVESTHDIQTIRPEVVIACVNEVVDKVRERLRDTAHHSHAHALRSEE